MVIIILFVYTEMSNNTTVLLLCYVKTRHYLDIS